MFQVDLNLMIEKISLVLNDDTEEFFEDSVILGTII